jgi:hypothetical protein
LSTLRLELFFSRSLGIETIRRLEKRARRRLDDDVYFARFRQETHRFDQFRFHPWLASPEAFEKHERQPASKLKFMGCRFISYWHSFRQLDRWMIVELMITFFVDQMVFGGVGGGGNAGLEAWH